MEGKTVEMPAANVGMLRQLVAGMRAQSGQWYTTDQWTKLCNDIEACLPEEAGAEKPVASDDTMYRLGSMVGSGLGLALANSRGGSPNITVYVTCNGK